MAIIAVVVGHCNSPFVIAIYMFHMPLFFFLSGCFFADRLIYKPFQFAKKLIISLYVPYVLYGAFFILMHNYLFDLNIYSKLLDKGEIIIPYSLHESIKRLSDLLTLWPTEQIVGALWFIPVLLIVNVLFLITSYISNKSSKMPIVINIFMVASLFYAGHWLKLQAIIIPRLGNVSMVALAFYCMGYYYKKYESEIQIPSIFVLIALIVFYYNLQAGNFVNLSALEYAGGPSFLLTSAISGIVLSLYIARIIGSNRLLEYIGRNTFVIFVLHFLAFKVVNLLQVYCYDYPIYFIAKFPVLNGSGWWWLIYSIAGVFLPLGAKLIVEGIYNKVRYDLI